MAVHPYLFGIVCAADIDGASERIVISMAAHASRVVIAPQISNVARRVIGGTPHAHEHNLGEADEPNDRGRKAIQLRAGKM
jgi:hypothetical protein